MNYKEVLNFLYTQLPMYQRVGKTAFKKDLVNTLQLAQSLGNPHQKFRSIHVAGTNGKGSTSHMIASVLQSAGYRVGLYTSPHLRSFRERIRVNGQEVEETFVTEFVNQNKESILSISPSFFEITVVMAFEYFAHKSVDFAVIETGLGGRLDSTNIITPLLSVITSISLDHQDMLGDSIEKIAKEKAGIIKKEVPVVIGDLPDAAVKVMKADAESKNSTFIHASKSPKKLGDVASDLSETVVRLNLDTVKGVVDALIDANVAIAESQFVHGIGHVVKQTGLKGRWQQLSLRPRVICDVGHNEEAVGWIMDQLLVIPHRKLHIVWGVTSDKATENIFRLLNKEATYYFCAADVPRALAVGDLARRAGNYELHGESYSSVDKAYRAAVSNASADDLIFIGGSTFVVAEIEDL